MTRSVFWMLTLVAAVAAYVAIGPTPVAGACPPTPECLCP
jgi:hypothetical protein